MFRFSIMCWQKILLLTTTTNNYYELIEMKIYVGS